MVVVEPRRVELAEPTAEGRLALTVVFVFPVILVLVGKDVS
jgi:hypothetical protein